MAVDIKYLQYIGHGQWGEVYLVQDNKSKEQMALKKLAKKQFQSKASKKNLISEIQIMQKLCSCQNENIVILKDVVQSPDYYYLFMDYCADGDLEQEIQRKKKLGEEEAVQILLQILNGLKGLHELMVVHRDLKPQNIFISNGVYKIGDFGFARQTQGQSLEDLYQKSTICGSPAFMAPELLDQSQSYTSKVDLWAVGVIYYYMIFGIYPFALMTKADQPNSIFQFQVEGNYPFLNFDNAIIKLNKYVSEQVAQKLHSKELSDFFSEIFVVDPLIRIDWTDFYVHPFITKYCQKQYSSQLQNQKNEFYLMSIEMEKYDKTAIAQKDLTKKYENQKAQYKEFYTKVQEKEIGVLQSVSKLMQSKRQDNKEDQKKYEQQLLKQQNQLLQIPTEKKEKEISNVEQTVMDKQIVVDYPKQLTKQQQQQQMKARYLFEKDVIQFLSQTCIKIVSTSAESEELKIVFSNSTLFCLVNYYFLKFKWLQSKIEEKYNIFQLNEFEEFSQTIYYNQLIERFKKDSDQVNNFKDYIAVKTQQSFDATVWQKMKEIKNPKDFKQLFDKQVTHFTNVCLQNGKNEKNPQNKEKILQIACFLAYSKGIDFIFSFEQQRNLALVKENIEKMNATELLDLVQKIMNQKS